MRVQKRYILLGVVFLVLVSFFVNLPFLFDKKESKEIDIDKGKIAVISDLHLESNPRDLTCIGDYLKNEEISLLILNGDVFDKRHKTPLKEEDLVYIQSRLGIENNDSFDIIYLLSSYNHDPYLREEYKIDDDKKIEVWEGPIILKINKKEETKESFYIFHGDYIFSGYNIGIASVVNKLNSSLLYEQFAKLVIGGEKDEWIILSHSHIPGIDYQRKVANTGSWIKRYIANTDTAILIDASEQNEHLEVILVEVPCN